VRWWLSQESLGTGGRDDIRTVSKSLQGIKDPLPKALEKTLPSHSFLYYFPLKLRGVVAQDGRSLFCAGFILSVHLEKPEEEDFWW
jgi:hypothetical protein